MLKQAYKIPAEIDVIYRSYYSVVSIIANGTTYPCSKVYIGNPPNFNHYPIHVSAELFDKQDSHIDVEFTKLLAEHIGRDRKVMLKNLIKLLNIHHEQIIEILVIWISVEKHLNIIWNYCSKFRMLTRAIKRAFAFNNHTNINILQKLRSGPDNEVAYYANNNYYDRL